VVKRPFSSIFSACFRGIRQTAIPAHVDPPLVKGCGLLFGEIFKAMAGKLILMHQVRLIIQLHGKGQGKRAIARHLSMSRNTVRRYLDRIEQSGYSLDELEALDDAALRLVCEPAPAEGPDERYAFLQAELPLLLPELKRRGVTRQLLWEEYRARQPTGYGYSQFCFYLNQRLAHGSVTAVFGHKPGEQMMIDFAGQPLRYVDEDTGQTVVCPVFVAVLPFSNMTYCQALPRADQSSFAHALGEALRYFGGVPQSVLFDNGRQAVIKADRYEPVFTELAGQLAAHYRFYFMATRVRKPRDKPHVEGAVRISYQRIYARLRHDVHGSLASLNHRVYEMVDAVNVRMMKNKGYSRRSLFDRKERALLQALPADPFVLTRTLQATVQRDYHVWLGEDKHFYSVPYRWVGKRVSVTYSDQSVEIYAGLERIAVHRRRHQAYGYSTTHEHMPSSHQAVHRSRGWDKTYFLAQAEQIGPSTRKAIAQVLGRKQYTEQNYKSCLGILRLRDHYTPQRLERASGMAAEHGAASYTVIKNILKNRTDQIAEQEEIPFTTPQHDNIRGADQYT